MGCKMVRRMFWVLFAGLLLTATPARAREWTDSTGKFKQQADLVDFDDQTAVLKKADGRLVAVPLDKLSQADRDFLNSKDAAKAVEDEASDDRTWTLADDTTVKGKVLGYIRADLLLERRAGTVQVTLTDESGNALVRRKPFSQMTKLHQVVVPQIVNHFEKTSIKDLKGLERALDKKKGLSEKYGVEGVVLELDDGQKFGVPFFLFSDTDQKVLKPGWKEWEAAAEDKKKQQQQALMVRSLANAYQRDRNMTQQIELLKLGSDWFDLWQVGLVVDGQMTSVVVPGRNSQQAAAGALAKYPGANVIGIQKLQRRKF
jgi:hypothetical protein